MKKRITLLVAMATLLAVTALVACSTTPDTGAASVQSEAVSQPEPETTSVPEPDASSQPEESSVPEEPETSTPVEEISIEIAGAGDLADNWDSYQLMLDGVVYTFPMSFADLEVNGWEIDAGAAGAALPSNTASSVDYSKDGTTLSFNAVNTGSAALPINECDCIGVTFDRWKIGDMSFAIPGGFTLQSSSEDVLEAYGEPVEEYINSNGVLISLSYGPASQRYQVRFMEDYGLVEVRIYHK